MQASGCAPIWDNMMAFVLTDWGKLHKVSIRITVILTEFWTGYVQNTREVGSIVTSVNLHSFSVLEKINNMQNGSKNTTMMWEIYYTRKLKVMYTDNCNVTEMTMKNNVVQCTHPLHARFKNCPLLWQDVTRRRR